MLQVAKNPQKCKPSAFVGHTAYMSYKPSAYAGQIAYRQCKPSAFIGHTAYRLLRDGAVNYFRRRHVADVFAECVL